MTQFQENAPTDGRTEGRMEGQKDGQRDGRTDRIYFIGIFRLLPGVQLGLPIFTQHN